jgi:hypothetical protein
MTKKELRALYRAAHGPKWFEDPEVRAEYKLKQRPVKAAPAKPRAKPRAKPKPPLKKPRMSVREVREVRGVLAPRLLGGGVFVTGTKEEDRKTRPLAVVQVGPNKVRAFYMSTGTGGQTEAGEWNLFGGIAEEGYGAPLGWFIKPEEGKRVPKYAPVSAWLTRTVGDNAVEAATYMKQQGFPRFSSTPTELKERRKLLKTAERESEEYEALKERVETVKWEVRAEGGDVYEDDRVERLQQELRDFDTGDMESAIKRFLDLREKHDRSMGRKLNRYLGGLGAIHAHEEDPRKRVERAQREGHMTVRQHPRVAFNPRR